MTEHNHANSETRTGRSRANDSAMKDSAIRQSRRLPDIPWKYNPPAPENVVRPKPVIVPKAK